MAKSLRSKRRRKMLAIKRERYAVKELAQLKGILENAEKQDVDLSEICTVLPEGSLSNKSQEVKLEKTETTLEETSSAMEVDTKTPKYHSRKLTDEHGHYPVWMNQRKIQKHKAKLRRKNGKKNNKKR